MKAIRSNPMGLALAVSLGGFLFGFDASVISGVVRFIVADFNLSDWALGFVVSAPTLGGVIAGGTVSPLSDRFGRKRVLIIIALLYSISAVVSALAPSYAVLAFARFLGGLGFGSLGLAPIYIAEIAPARLRGRMISFNQFNIVIGFSAAYFANYLLLKAGTSGAAWVQQLGIDIHTWRWMLGLECVPAFSYLLLLFAIPESPRWLVLQGRVVEARQVFSRWMSESEVDARIAEIQDSVGEGLEPVLRRFRALFGPGVRVVLGIGLIVAVAQQITGINAVYFYAPSIFEQSGVGTDAAFAQAIWIGIINVGFTIIAMALIDRLGRKPLLVAGLIGVMISMLICSYGFDRATYRLSVDSLVGLRGSVEVGKLDQVVGRSFDSDTEYKAALRECIGESAARQHESALIQAAIQVNSTLILVGILGFVASFAASLGPVMWVLLPEIFSNRLRGVAMAITGSINSLVSFGVQLVFPWELTTLGSAPTFLVYAAFAAVSLVLVTWLLPETRGKTLEQLEGEMMGCAADLKQEGARR